MNAQLQDDFAPVGALSTEQEQEILRIVAPPVVEPDPMIEAAQHEAMLRNMGSPESEWL